MADTLTVDKKDLEKNDNVLFSLFGLEYTKQDALVDGGLLAATAAFTGGLGTPFAVGASAVRFVGTQLVKGGIKAAAKSVAKTAVKEGAEATAKEAAKEGAEATAKAGVEAAAKNTSKEAAKDMGEELAKKVDATRGQRFQNKINEKFEESNWLTRNLVGKPVASIAGKAVDNPIKTAAKTAIVADVGVNTVSQSITPDDPDNSLAYNVGAATISDGFAAGRGLINLAGGAVALVPGVGPSVAHWVKDTAPNAAKHLYEGAGQAMNGAMSQAGKEAGIDIDPAATSLPPLPGAGIVTRLGKSAHNAQVNAGKRGSSTAASELNDGQGIESDKTPGMDLLGAAQDKASGAAQAADNGLDVMMEEMDFSDQNAVWDKMKLSAKKNPIIQKMVDIGEANPLVKYGMASGFALGMVRGGLEGGNAKERAKIGFSKGMDFALALGVIAFIIGKAFGPEKSLAFTQNLVGMVTDNTSKLVNKAETAMNKDAAPAQDVPRPKAPVTQYPAPAPAPG